jgi:hypothetical protein
MRLLTFVALVVVLVAAVWRRPKQRAHFTTTPVNVAGLWTGTSTSNGVLNPFRAAGRIVGGRSSCYPPQSKLRG